MRCSFKAKKLFGIMLLGVCLVILIHYPPGSEAATQLTPGSSERHELVGGASEVFGIAVGQDQLVRITIDKGDLLLTTTLYGPTGAKLLEHFSQDFEVVELSFPAQLAGAYTIELRSQEKDPTPRQYELKVQPLTAATALNRKDSEARQAIADGEILRAKFVAASFREATDQFDKATLTWKFISDFANAAHAALKSGDVFFSISEYQEASKRYQNAEALAEKARDWLARARALSQLGRVLSASGNNDSAQKQLNEALNLFKQHEADRNAIATNAYGDALTNLAEVSYSKGNFVKSLAYLDNALKVFQNYRKGEARVHLLFGQITGSIGETERGLAELAKARELYQSVNDKNGETLAFMTPELGRSRSENSRIEVALEALEVFTSTGDRKNEATALNLFATINQRLKKFDIAIYYFRKSLKLSQDIGSVDGATASALGLASVFEESEKPDQALVYYELCLKLARSVGNARDEVYALKGLATIYALQGRHKLAAELYQKTLKFYESSSDLRGQSLVLNAYGEFLLERQKKQEALETFSRALEFSERVNEPGVVISTFYNVARAHLALGSPDAARPVIQKSLSLIESLRANVASPEYRASYFSGVQGNYELCIHVLMQLEKLKPGQGFAAEALAVSERARARLLVDLVSQARSTPHAGVASDELLELERRLSGLLRAQTEYRITLSPNQNAELAEADDDLIQLRVEYEKVRAKLSQRRPHLFSIEQALPLDVQRIQNELRGSDTMLLEYSLGEPSSYLWAVTSDSLQFYELPARSIIGDAAREYYRLLTAIQGTEGQVSKDYQRNVDEADKLLSEKANYLSGIVLGPLAGQLGTRRLLVVAEGALQYIPFDALPVPGAKDGTLLLDTNEVVVSPSISTLIAIRAKQNRSYSTGKLVAGIADPVFSGSDNRVQRNANSSEKKQLNRLVHASEEADAIAALAPWGTTLMVKGFDASRNTAMSSDVAQYQIIHFATHAVPNEEHPELSSVVLTMVDRNGEKADGLMPLHDIYSLDLAAELTVLSACQTALGKETKGEGLVGLAHGFMSAGSRTVVASLWKVDDRATAVLMTNFYDAMLQQDMSPAAALRSAKLKMRRDKQWAAPYYWAGFVVQGEYKNHIAVDHHATLFGLILLILLALTAAALVIFQKRRFSAPHSS